MTRCVLIADVWAPEHATAAAAMMESLALALQDAGHAVIAVTPGERTTARPTLDRSGVVPVLRAPAARAKGRRLWWRGLAEASWPFALARAWRAADLDDFAPQAVIWYSPSIFLGAFAGWLKRRHGAATYLILRDLFPDWAVEAGILSPGPVLAGLQAVADHQCRMADVIGAQTAGDVERVRRAHPAARVEVLGPWMASPADPPAPADDPAPREPVSREPTFVCGGALGPAQDLAALLNLAEALEAWPAARLRVLAQGEGAARLRAEGAARGLRRLSVEPIVSPEAFHALLRTATAGVVSLHPAVTTGNLPGRLIAHCAAGVPTLAFAPAGSAVDGLIRETGAGLTVQAGDGAGLRAALARLIDAPAKRARMGRAARAAMARFSPEAAAERILRALADARPDAISA